MFVVPSIIGLGVQMVEKIKQSAMLDLVVYSHVAQLVKIEKDYPCPMRDYLEANCKNLVGLVNRMKDRYWKITGPQ